MDFSQRHIVEKLQVYLDFKKSKMSSKLEQDNCVLPFSTTAGLCSGLSAYWLYFKCTGKEGKFLQQLEYLLTWDKSKISVQETEDEKIEDFMNAIEFLQFDTELRSEIRQVDLDQSFKVLLAKDAPQVTPVEFKTTFVFTEQVLQEYLTKSIQENKMVRIANNNHVISLVYTNGSYFLYDPESKLGPTAYANTTELAAQIFKSITVFTKSQDPIALNVSIFDLSSKPKAKDKNEYQAAEEYCSKLLNDKAYKQVIINNSQIFDLAMWYQDISLANYLIKEGLDLNLRTPAGTTPLESALAERDTEMLFKLIAEGANPKLPTSKGISLLELALKNRHFEAIIILLAFGVDFTQQQLDAISARFKYSQYKAIVRHAIELNQKLLQAPELLNLDSANGRDIVTFLRNCKLKIQLGKPADEIKLKIENRNFIGIEALNILITHCHALKNNDLFDCAQKTEILELLKYHLPTDFKTEGDQELLQLLSTIEQNIRTRDLNTTSKADLQEISIILDHLDAISKHWHTLYPKRLYICYSAKAVKAEIESQLADVGIDSIKKTITQLQLGLSDHQRNYLFFTPDKEKSEPLFTFSTDIAPLLRL